MAERSRQIALEWVIVPCLLLATFAIHRTNLSLESMAIERRADGEVGPLPDGNALRVLSLGFERLVADLFWVRTVYYVGDEAAGNAGYPSAERLANLVTDIDPNFDTVYVLMSSVMNGLRTDPDAAIRLLEKGARNSNYWRIHFLLGFNYFMEKQDYERGAQALQKAVDLGGPPYLQFLVTRLYAHVGEADTAMSFIQARLIHEESPKIRKRLEKRFSDLWINRDTASIDQAIEKYSAAHGRAPERVDELVEGGFLPKQPRDPKGGVYTIESGHASSAIPYEVLRLKK
ncbi:MAG: tetratricopeptide repeat protein [bacterium]